MAVIDSNELVNMRVCVILRYYPAHY